MEHRRNHPPTEQEWQTFADQAKDGRTTDKEVTAQQTGEKHQEEKRRKN